MQYNTAFSNYCVGHQQRSRWQFIFFIFDWWSARNRRHFFNFNIVEEMTCDVFFKLELISNYNVLCCLHRAALLKYRQRLKFQCAHTHFQMVIFLCKVWLLSLQLRRQSVGKRRSVNTELNKMFPDFDFKT